MQYKYIMQSMVRLCRRSTFYNAVQIHCKIYCTLCSTSTLYNVQCTSMQYKYNIMYIYAVQVHYNVHLCSTSTLLCTFMQYEYIIMYIYAVQVSTCMYCSQLAHDLFLSVGF